MEKKLNDILINANFEALIEKINEKNTTIIQKHDQNDKTSP